VRKLALLTIGGRVDGQDRDDSARSDGDAKDAQHEPARPACRKAHTEEQRHREVRREPDHPSSTARGSRCVIEG